MNEGISGLWVGFPTYYFRIAPHAMIVDYYMNFKINNNFTFKVLLIQDYLKDVVSKMRKKN